LSFISCTNRTKIVSRLGGWMEFRKTMSGINSKVEVLVQVRPINFSKLFSLVQTLLWELYLLPFANLMSAELQSRGKGESGMGISLSWIKWVCTFPLGVMLNSEFYTPHFSLSEPLPKKKKKRKKKRKEKKKKKKIHLATNSRKTNLMERNLVRVQSHPLPNSEGHIPVTGCFQCPPTTTTTSSRLQVQGKALTGFTLTIGSKSTKTVNFGIRSPLGILLAAVEKHINYSPSLFFSMPSPSSPSTPSPSILMSFQREG